MSARMPRRREPQHWEADAIALDAKMWAAAYRTSADADALARQARELLTAAQVGPPADHRPLDAVRPETTDDGKRSWADRRAIPRS
jgi:hypothetical protein